MTYRQLFLKALFVNTFFFFSIALNAQVMWNLKGGFMPVNVQHFDDDSEQRVNWMAGLEIEIPTSKKFNIETGLRYKNEMLCFDYSDEYHMDHTKNHLEVPIRLAYKCKLRDNLAIRAGIGPYLGVGLEGDGIDPKIGIEPSVALDWKCLSLGLTYNHPFYLGERAKYKANSGLMLTLGIRFGSNKWKYVGAGLVAASVVASTVYAATQGNNSDSNYSQNNNSSVSNPVFEPTANTSNSSMKQSSNPSQLRKKTCSKCGGKGYDSQRYDHNPGGTSIGWKLPYLNTDGVKCPYCEVSYKHWHAPCVRCQGYGEETMTSTEAGF